MEPTSATLLMRLKADGPAREIAWTEFRRRYAPIIAGFARNLGVPPQEVDDLIQNVLTAFYAAQPRFTYDPSRGRFRGYLKTCVTHLLSHRKDRRLQLDGRSVDQIDVADESVEKAWNDAWEREHLHRAVESLRRQFDDSPKFQAFYRVSIEGRPPAEVADALGMSLDAVYLAKSRCLARLRLLLKELEEHEG
jgi:RNA polymerase sigma factor (sigma-70 family)